MNTPVASLFDNYDYYQTFATPNTYKKQDDNGIEPLLEESQPDFLVRLYLGSLTIVGLYILFRVLD